MGTVRVRIYGEQEALAKATQLIRAGNGGLKDAMYDAVRRANAGVERELRQSILRRLPNTNGLAREVATARISVRSTFASGAGSAEGVGVIIRADHEYDLRGLDRGLNIHPLFGNRTRWYPQSVRPGWWSSVIRGQIGETKAAISRAAVIYMKRHGL